MIDRILDNPELRQAAERLAPGGVVQVSGVWGSAGPLAAAAVGRISGRPVLLITAHLDDADDAADDIEVFTGSPAEQFPAWEVDVGTEHINEEVASERIRVCNTLQMEFGVRSSEFSDNDDSPARSRLRDGDDNSPARSRSRLRDGDDDSPACSGPRLRDVVVAPIMALLQPVPTPEALAASKLPIERGSELSFEKLLDWLVAAEFEHVEQVDGQGQFAHRGGIVDVMPWGRPQAIRIEFFGDEVDSLRLFDLDTQRSTEELQAVELTSMAAAHEADPRRTTSLLDYLPAETILCMVEPAEVNELAKELHRRLEADGDGGRPVRRLFPPEKVFRRMRSFAQLQMFTFTPKSAAGKIDLGLRSLERISLNTREALEELSQLSETADVWVYCETSAEEERFRELLRTSHRALAEDLHTGIGHVHTGFHWPGERLVVVGHHEIFHRYSKVRRIRRVRAGRPIENLLDLTEGDYVVHVGHGIARFEGLRTLEKDGRKEEYLRLRFGGNAVLNVPAGRINLVQKYIGAGRKRPSLSKLGGAAWSRQKQRAAESVKDMAAELLRVQAMRRASPGVSFPAGTVMQRQFAAEFIYTETEDQLAAIAEIDSDMAEPRPMDRLLCGDVGFGKTEVAMRAAFKAVEAGRQAAVLVPTTVLADQHYRTFRERFADYPVNVEVLSRFRKPREVADVLRRLSLGQVDVLIGTHRILSKDVRFGELGLVIIDEEQRFGVEHKERLKGMRAMVEVLTMTATPIPRTLHMALLGLRDISALSTPPLDRRAIHTEVCQYDDRLIRQAILRELARDGQAFFLNNRVHNIQSVADHVQGLVPEARVAFAHGQMTGEELESVMLRFVRREIDVLVCTTIIESGLDIPTANTMIIQDCDRFGLAELHQLRGRVGRYKHRAYCYLLLPQTRPVSLEASKRLKAIEEFSDLGAGFQIAMRDLEIRGAGNILGAEQSGHIAVVGYELYCQLLEEAVGELKGEAPPPKMDVHVELGIDAYIPRSYVPSERQRMEVYRRMAACRTAEQIDQLARDLVDAYGRRPPVVETLLDVTEARVRAAALGIDSIIRMDPDLIFTFRDFSAAKGLFDDAPGSVRLPDDHTVHWRPPPTYRRMPTLLNVLVNRLRRTAGSV